MCLMLLLLLLLTLMVNLLPGDSTPIHRRKTVAITRHVAGGISVTAIITIPAPMAESSHSGTTLVFSMMAFQQSNEIPQQFGGNWGAGT